MLHAGRRSDPGGRQTFWGLYGFDPAALDQFLTGYLVGAGELPAVNAGPRKASDR